MTADVESARRDWEDGYRRLVATTSDPVEGDRLHMQVDAILAELRKRVGATFTIAQLAEAYAASEAWLRETIDERAPVPGWPRTVTVAGDAAFHLYARAALDYAP
ncbi:MAG: hypothetical protein ABI927_01685 [Gaiellaceae bacterium]